MASGLILLERGPKANKPPGLPGGKREPRESLVETALRELREETSVEGRLTTLLCTVQAGEHLCAIVMVHTWVSPKPRLPNGVTWEHPRALLSGSRFPDVYAGILADLVAAGFPNRAFDR